MKKQTNRLIGKCNDHELHSDGQSIETGVNFRVLFSTTKKMLVINVFVLIFKSFIFVTQSQINSIPFTQTAIEK